MARSKSTCKREGVGSRLRYSSSTCKATTAIDSRPRLVFLRGSADQGREGLVEDVALGGGYEVVEGEDGGAGEGVFELLYLGRELGSELLDLSLVDYVAGVAIEDAVLLVALVDHGNGLGIG